MRNNKIRILVEIAVFAALGLVLDFICGLIFSFAWLNGGSITIAMVPIYIMGLRWGLKGGLATGVLIGVTQILWAKGSYLVHPVQIFLDYPMGYGIVGLAGAFSSKLKTMKGLKEITWVVVATAVPGLLRLLSHTFAGLYFEVPFWSSLIYNAGYMIPSIVISAILMILFVKEYRYLVYFEEEAE